MVESFVFLFHFISNNLQDQIFKHLLKYVTSVIYKGIIKINSIFILYLEQ